MACGVLAAGALLVLPRAGANKNFVPDWTFQDSSLASAHVAHSLLCAGASFNKRHDPIIEIVKAGPLCSGPSGWRSNQPRATRK